MDIVTKDKEASYIALTEMYKNNPVAAARDILGIDLAPHQRVALRYMWEKNNVILLCSRGLGKCVDYNTLCITDTGFYKIGEMHRTEDYGFDDAHYNMYGENGINSTSHTFKNQPEPVYSVGTRFGYTLKAVAKHTIRCIENGKIIWKRMDEIKEGDVVLIDRDDTIDFKGEYSWITEDEAYLLGALIGDGCFVKAGGVGFTNIDEDILNEFRRNYQLLGARDFSSHKEEKEFSLLFGSKGADNEFFEKYKISRTKSDLKEIPDTILKSSKKALASFISGYADTDGSVLQEHIEFSSCSELLIRQLQVCLLSFGIISKVRLKRVKYKDGRNNAWVLSIFSDNRDIFLRKIGFRCKRKQNKLKAVLDGVENNPNCDTIKNCAQLFLDIREEAGKHITLRNEHRILGKHYVNKYSISYAKAKSMLDATKEYCENIESWQMLAHLYGKRYFMDTVKVVTKGECDVTYDVHIPEDHTFLSNGFISHNTFMDALFATLRALLFPSEKVGIMAPSFRQCLDIDAMTPVFTENGMYLPADLYDNIECNATKVQSIHAANTVKNKWLNDIEDGVYVRTSGIFDFKAKNGHRVLVSDRDGLQYKKIESISVGDTLPIRIGFNLWGNTMRLPKERYVTSWRDKEITIPQYLTDDFAYFLGLIIGDGCITKRKKKSGFRIIFTTNDIDQLDRYQTICKKLFNIIPTIEKQIDASCYHITITSRRLYEFLVQCGLSNCGATKKMVPSVIKSAPKQYVSAFLGGLFDTDGYACKNCNLIGISTSSFCLAVEVRALLLNMGVFAKISVSTKAGEYNINGITGNGQEGYSIRVTSLKYIAAFRDTITYRLKRKADIIGTYDFESGCRWSDRLVTPKNLIGKLKEELQTKFGIKRGAGILRKAFGQMQSSYITPERLRNGIVFLYDYLAESALLQELDRMYAPEYAFIQITELDSCRVKTFDIEVEKEDCYWAGGIIHHNSKFVFAEVEKFYDMSPDLREACVKKPVKGTDMCYLDFMPSANRAGSTLHCLPLGDGGKIRGARYFTILADETAQIPREILDVVVRGMMATSKNPMESVKWLEEQKRLLAEGKIDKIQKLHQSKIVFSSTAYYQYNHFWDRVSSYQDLLLKKHEEAQHLIEQGKEVPEELKVELRGEPLNGGQIAYNVMADEDRVLLAFPYTVAPEGFMNEESIEEAKREMPRYQYLMEYHGFFPADSDGFFPRSLLDKAQSHREFTCELEAEKGNDFKYIMGIDPAREGDNCAIAIVKVYPKDKKVRLVRMIAYHKKSFPEIHLEIRKLMKVYNISEISMDSGGGGRTLRDLLASKEVCPPGEDIILQRGFDEHRFKKGKRILRLVEFSNYDWLHDANHNMLLSLQNGSFEIACEKGKLLKCDNYNESYNEEQAYKELSKALDEMQNIITKTTPSGRMQWLTPSKRQKKDRYSAMLIAHDMGYSYIDNLDKPQELVSGFWS